MEVKNFSDYCHNGLQVEGMKEITKIVLGVSLSAELVRRSVVSKAQMIMVHHGLFNDNIGRPVQIKGVTKNRLSLLLKNDLNLCGFHLPLDAHPLIGNNISLCRLFGIKDVRPIDVGFIGILTKPMGLKSFVALVNKKLSTNSYYLACGPKTVKKIGVISGASSPDFKLAAEFGADTYLCGDIRESVVEAVKEMEINLINAGHYNTEKLGIQNLGKLLEKKFKVKTEFIDIPNNI